MIESLHGDEANICTALQLGESSLIGEFVRFGHLNSAWSYIFAE